MAASISFNNRREILLTQNQEWLSSFVECGETLELPGLSYLLGMGGLMRILCGDETTLCPAYGMTSKWSPKPIEERREENGGGPYWQ